MKSILCVCIAGGVFISACAALASPAVYTDPRTAPLSQRDLVLAIRSEKPDSPANVLLLNRAAYSDRSDVSYQEYKALSSRYPQDANRHLWYGIACLNFMQSTRTRKGGRSFVRFGALLKESTKELALAAERLPTSAVAQKAHGFVLWQYGNNMAEGLKRMQQAEKLDPKNPSVHLVLGLVYENPTGNAYSLPKAKKEYQEAIRLDPLFAAPHKGLARVYDALGKPNEAAQETRTCLSLTEPQPKALR